MANNISDPLVCARVRACVCVCVCVLLDMYRVFRDIMVLRVKIYYRALCHKLRHLARTLLAVEEKRISYPDPEMQLLFFFLTLADLTNYHCCLLSA